MAGHTHGVHGLEGNDTIKGSAYNDWLYGEAGNDTIYGNNGNDVFFGGGAADKLYGNNGSDVLMGEQGADRLEGGAGADRLYGGYGNDDYVWTTGGGIDTINDDKSLAGTGVGGGAIDEVYMPFTLANIAVVANQGDGNDLYITSEADWADGVMNGGVIIEDFHDGGANMVELLIDINGNQLGLSAYL